MFGIIKRAALGLLISFLLPMITAAQVSVDITNGGFTTDLTGWTSVSGSTSWQPAGDNSPCVSPDPASDYLCTLEGARETTDYITIPLDAAERDGAPWDMAFSTQQNGSQKYKIDIKFYDATDALVETVTTGLVVGPLTWERDTLEHPAMSGVLNISSTKFKVRVQGGIYLGLDDIGPMLIASGGGGGGGGGGEDPPPDYTVGDLDGLTDTLDDFSSVIDGINNFACGQLTDPGSGTLASITGGSGGGGLGAIIGIILNINLTQIQQLIEDMQRNCMAAENNTQNEIIIDAVTDPQDAPNIYVGVDASDPTAMTLREHVDQGIGTYDVGDDDLVTSTNKTNRLLIAQARMNAESWDRALGGPRQDYETEQGPKITEADIIAGEANLEFAEGDYGQNYGRLKTLAEDIEPDFLGEQPLQAPVDAEVGVGGCVADDYPLGGEGWAGAIAQVKYNAAQSMAKSNLGLFICRLTNPPPTQVVSLCLGPSGGMLVPNTDTYIIEPNGLCIYGPEAPSFMDILWDMLPIFIMLMSVISSIKMWIH